MESNTTHDPSPLDLEAEVLLPGNESDPSRRAFLRMAGFGIASATLSGCSRAPVQKVVPFLQGSEHIIAGKAYWVATTCSGCSAGCGVLARCRDGRPVKLEGNAEHKLSQGGLCAVGHSEILSVYDSFRLPFPVRDGEAVDWKTADAEVVGLLEKASMSGGRVRLLTGSIHSPSTQATIQRFLATLKDGKHVTYDALSTSALLDAHEQTHGARFVPAYRFDKARVIASFDADFLGTWISPVQFAADYAAGRRPDTDGGDGRGHMSHHIQFEGLMSLTGSAADVRTRVAPWEMTSVLGALCEYLEGQAGGTGRMQGLLESCPVPERVRSAGAALWEARGHALVVAGSNDLEIQLLAAYANHLLGSYGNTLSLARPSLQNQGDDKALWDLKAELDAGLVDILVVSGANPAYDLPAGFAASLASAGTLVVHSDGLDETSALGRLRLPASHFLESWGDGQPQVGRFSLTQPALPPIRDGRTLRRILAAWMGDTRDDDAILRDTWKEGGIQALCGGSGVSFGAFFDGALHEGYLEATRGAEAEPRFNLGAISAPPASAPRSGLGLALYPKVGLRSGEHAHNPWLQELPDPISKIVWDNYAAVSESRAAELGLQEGDVVHLEVDGFALDVPVHIQRGQHDDVVGLALGYGRAGTDRFANVGPQWLEGKSTVEEGQTVGVNAAPMLTHRDGLLRYDRANVTLAATGARVDLAVTQEHHSLDVPANLAPPGGETRDAVQTADFADYQKHPAHAVHIHDLPEADLWPDDHEPKRHHWGMAVDLASCTGCSACMISCQAENNVPVVGKDEVRRHREMHWIRIDRYLEGEGDNVSAAYQPMFCQQCDNAPCEAVCPVLATVHSSEGLNQQVYNRCVGTRYCANTCPYKVRRFNWFNYPREDELQNHALNPDVTVRSRGVMEKCSFCAQRIQEAKTEATRRGTPLLDGEIQAACQQSCPTSAIVFGDMNDPESGVSRLMTRQRAYGVLSELNVKPSVRYLARIRNSGQGEQDHG